MSPEQVHQRNIRRVRVDGINPKERTFELKGAKIAVVGLSPDGLSLSIRAGACGFKTVGFDADEVKVAQLQGRKADFLAPEDAEAFRRAQALSISADESDLKDSDIFILCGARSALEEAANAVARHLKEGALVILESIVSPGTCEHVLWPILEKGSGLARPAFGVGRGDFFFAHAPMRTTSDVRVVGAADEESLLRAVSFYRQIFGTEATAMHSIKEAESLRMVERAFGDVALAVADELAIGFDKMGIDVVNVIKTASMSRPFSLPLPGIRGSQSSPKTRYLTRSGHEHELEQPFLEGSRRIVSRMPAYAVKVLSDALREKRQALKGAAVALLGLAREEDSSGAEDGSAFIIRDALAKKGADVRVFDPFVPGAGRDLKETLTGAEACVIAGDHAMFRNLTPRQFEEFGISIVVDACNCLDKKSFEKSPVLYRGIGRG